MRKLIPVFYRLVVDDRTFTKAVKVSSIPQVGTLLKATNNSFIVKEHEQDLDAYDGADALNGLFCDSVRAELNEHLYLDKYDHSDVIKDLLGNRWNEKK